MPGDRREARDRQLVVRRILHPEALIRWFDIRFGSGSLGRRGHDTPRDVAGLSCILKVTRSGTGCQSGGAKRKGRPATSTGRPLHFIRRSLSAAATGGIARRSAPSGRGGTRDYFFTSNS